MAGIQDLIKSYKKIPTANPNDHLGSVLEAVRSSHDPVFVFDDNALSGVVSASYSLFKRRYPLNTKVKHALRKIPNITEKSDISTVAKRMLSTEIYTLPVFKKGKIIGVISVNQILRQALSDEKLMEKINGNVDIDKPFVHDRNGKIREIFTKLRKEKTSRVLIVDFEGKLIGITTRRDIQEGLMPPTRKLRYGKKHGLRFQSESYDEEKIKRLDYPIQEFMKQNVITGNSNSTFKEMVALMLEKKVNSVVIADYNMRPTGVVTIKNILKALSQIELSEKITIKFSDKQKVLDKNDEEKIIDQLERFAEKYEKKNKIRIIEATVNAYHNKKGKITGFEIHLRAHFVNGKGYMTKVEDKKLMNAVNIAIDKIKSQFTD